MSYDVAVIGAGVIGLAHAWAAAERGKRVVVLDRDAAATGASIRNFGFVTVTGQEAGACWRLARRTRDVWAEIAEAAAIPVAQRGLTVTARRPEAEAVIDAFLETEMGAGCVKLGPEAARERVGALRGGALRAALASPHELRVESKTAIPRLAAWLAEARGVDFRWGVEAHAVEPPRIETSRGVIEAETAIACPGDALTGVFVDQLAARRVTRCKLQMLRLAPETPRRLETAIMSDLGLARYHGYADLPEAAALKARLDVEQAQERANGVHLIVVQSADGSLIVGDSHHYGDAVSPFGESRVDDLILNEFDAVLDMGPRRVTERWIGTYASAPDRWLLRAAPQEAARLVVITAGCGASTCFGVAEETITDLLG